MSASLQSPVPCHELPPAPGHVLACLADGGAALLRPLRPGETEPLLSVFEAMSLQSRASRYLTGIPRLTPGMLAVLADVDGRRHAAWLATESGRPAGIARYVEVEPGTAEIAFEVADTHHGRGLGTALLDTITTVAAANGMRRIRATVMPANAPSLRLLARMGIPLNLCDGLLEGEGPLSLLDPPRVDRAGVVDLSRAG